MKTTSLLKGLLVGAGCMYFFDPDRGRRRRALVKDQVNHQLNLKRNDLQVMQRDFSNRSRGLVHNLQARLQGDHPDDRILVERVRSAIGRCCTQTSGIEVMCNDGVVTVAGPALASEVQDLIGTVRNVRGVARVINNLQIHDTTEQIEAAGPSDVNRWTPAECLVAVCAGTVMSIYGIGKRGIVGWLMGSAGLALMANGFKDTEHRFDSRSTGNPSQSSIRVERAGVQSSSE